MHTKSLLSVVPVVVLVLMGCAQPTSTMGEGAAAPPSTSTGPEAADPARFDLKGVQLGMSRAQAWKALDVNPTWSAGCDWERKGDVRLQKCSINTTIASQRGVFVVVMNDSVYGGPVVALWLSAPTSAYPSMAQGLRDKYGAPMDTKDSTVSNRMGASFSQQESTWTNTAGEKIHVMARGGRVDRALITLEGKAWDAIESEGAKVKPGQL